VSTIVRSCPAVRVLDSWNVIFPGISMSKRWTCIHENFIAVTYKLRMNYLINNIIQLGKK
jgi:hypothetical protein